MKLKVFAYLIFIALIISSPTVAQENSSPIIDASNIRQLQSIAHIDFADLPEEAGVVDKGWFAVSANGEYFATVNRGNEIVLWSLEDGFVAVSSAGGCEDTLPGAFIDGLFYDSPTYRGSEMFSAVYASANGGIIAYHPFEKGAAVTTLCNSLPAQVPIRIWTTELAETWTEVIDQNSGQPTIHHFPIPFLLPAEASNSDKDQPITPDSDPDSFFRIGRIDAPLALTVTKEALLKRWNLEIGEVTASAQLDGLPAAGQVNSDGNDFAWVDQKFEALHLLNFESGQDSVIAPLGGTYIPFLLLSAKSDVIIGVNVGLEPNVIAWAVTTGERLDLGTYRNCKRQPDMVRLSKDGSTLVIGCDTGLDIWRVPETP